MNVPHHRPRPARREGSPCAEGFTLEQFLRRDDVASVYPRPRPATGNAARRGRPTASAPPTGAARRPSRTRRCWFPPPGWCRGWSRSGATGAELVVVAERVHAATLRDRSRDAEGLDPQGPRRHALLRVAEVLDWLHARGVVHRRPSPDDELVSGAGEVWLEVRPRPRAGRESGLEPHQRRARGRGVPHAPGGPLHRIHPQTDVFAPTPRSR